MNVFFETPSTVNKFLRILAIGDLAHILTFWLGAPEVLADVASWNDILWGNVAGCTILYTLRIATILGIFGSIGEKGKGKAKKG
jgi:hypothetical protein